jgi:isopenicillin N synthase-like dioxygenase
MLPVFDIFDGAAEEITSRLALNFNRDPSGMKAAFTKWSLLQFNYSRPSQATADFINDLHEDGCLLTLMSIAGAGLELKTEAGLTPVAASSEKILVMAGEILWLLTGGRINPIYHRVRRVPSYQARRSLLFFADMSPSICTPWVRNQVNQGINIGNKVLQNSSRFGLSKWIAED